MDQKNHLLLSKICHNLGNYVNSIHINLEVLITHFDDLENDTKIRFIKNALLQIESQQELLKAMATYVRGSRIRIQRFPLQPFGDSWTKALQPELKAKGIELKADGLRMPYGVVADRQPLSAVFEHRVDHGG